MSSVTKRQSLSTIESSVTRLLVATKKLLESLTQWAKHGATENDVSDSYVNLGNEFKVACRSFYNAGVDVSDLGDVPHSLRLVLEEALCEEPSQESLDKFLPIIREIIVSLLQNLKRKQAIAKDVQAANLGQATGSQPHQIRSVSGPATAPTTAASTPRIGTPKRTVSQNPSVEISSPTQSEDQNLLSVKQGSKDPLSQLQNGDFLKRRASKRFSAYQYAKLASFTPDKESELPSKLDNQGDKTPTRSPVINLDNGFIIDDSNASRADKIETIDTIKVYLKIGQKVKKVNLTGSLTTASLRLLFVEKFAYSPGSESFPELYIQDPNSNVSYELENLSDIQENCVISLQEAETETPLAKHLDEKMAALTSQVSDLQTSMSSFMDKVSQQAVPPPPISSTPSRSEVSLSRKASTPQISKTHSITLKEINDIKRDLAAIRQMSTNNKVSLKQSVDDISEKIRMFKETGYEASESSNRIYMESCRQKLSKDCETLLTKTDDLQDIIEAIRKDVAQRRARPDKKQLLVVLKELETSNLQLETVSDFIKVEKQNWKKIWETELNTVCEEQQFFNLQEELVVDLRDDLAKALETFNLVEECSDQLSKNPNMKVLPNLALGDPAGKLTDVRDALLSEVVALNPNHEDRVAAIEKAERLRQMQRGMSRGDHFEEELEGFVEGKKLKKSGGIEETERLRELHNRENLGFLD